MTPADRLAREKRLAGLRAEWLHVAGAPPVLLTLTLDGRPADFDRLTTDEYRTLLALTAKAYFGDPQ